MFVIIKLDVAHMNVSVIDVYDTRAESLEYIDQILRKKDEEVENRVVARDDCVEIYELISGLIGGTSKILIEKYFICLYEES